MAGSTLPYNFIISSSHEAIPKPPELVLWSVLSGVIFVWFWKIADDVSTKLIDVAIVESLVSSEHVSSMKNMTSKTY